MLLSLPVAFLERLAEVENLREGVRLGQSLQTAAKLERLRQERLRDLRTQMPLLVTVEQGFSTESGCRRLVLPS
jgi:hypothetical protein